MRQADIGDDSPRDASETEIQRSRERDTQDSTGRTYSIRPDRHPWLVVVLVVILFSGGLFGYDQGVIYGALHGIKATFSLSALLVEETRLAFVWPKVAPRRFVAEQ
jgi:hypothetical protein